LWMWVVDRIERGSRFGLIWVTPVDPVVLIDNTLAITMGPLLTMACKGHNQQSLCNCNGDN